VYAPFYFVYKCTLAVLKGPFHLSCKGPSELTLTIAGRNIMDLHTPSAWTFWLSVALVVIAIIVRFAHIPEVGSYAAWIGVLGYIVLVAGCIFKTT
jgi:hypothetical protein